jgi:hypothetical protein
MMMEICFAILVQLHKSQLRSDAVAEDSSETTCGILRHFQVVAKLCVCGHGKTKHGRTNKNLECFELVPFYFVGSNFVPASSGYQRCICTLYKMDNLKYLEAKVKKKTS